MLQAAVDAQSAKPDLDNRTNDALQNIKDDSLCTMRELEYYALASCKLNKELEDQNFETLSKDDC